MFATVFPWTAEILEAIFRIKIYKVCAIPTRKLLQPQQLLLFVFNLWVDKLETNVLKTNSAVTSENKKKPGYSNIISPSYW